MKKILLSVVAVAAIAVGYQKYNQSKTMSDLMLANVEALASGEESCCIGSKFQVTSIPGGWHCQNDMGNSCCPTC